MTDKLETLIKARALIEDPEKWTKGRYVRPLGGYDEDGYCYCAVGALITARSLIDCGYHPASGYDTTGITDTYTFKAVHSTLYSVLPDEWNNVPSFNDDQETTHEAVLALYDRAIEAARNE